MKNILKAFVAAASMALVAQSANAAYTDNDLLLGFRADSGTGSNFVLTIDLGSAVTLKNAAIGSVISLGNIGADLTTVYGANWNTRSDLFFGAAAIGNNTLSSKTFYATKAEETIGTLATGETLNSSLRAGCIADIGLWASGYVGNGVNSPNLAGFGINPAAQLSTKDQDTFSSVSSSDTGLHNLGSIEDNFGQGTAGAALDLFYIAGNTSTAVTTYEGTLTLNDAGDITFTVVPEPSTYAMLGLGAVGLIGMIRRRR